MPGDRPMLLIKNGRVIDPSSGTDAKRNIWIDRGRVTRIAPAEGPEAPPNGEALDATGLVVAPGFIDLHCHLREPGGRAPRQSKPARARPRAEALRPCVPCPTRVR